jgi:putative ABC transport system ATP-binding protein
MLELKNIIREYSIWDETIRVLKWIDLTIEDGEFIAIMGPSGSGKSTLMNMIGLLDRPTSGSYILDGFDTSKLTDDDEAAFRGKKIGFIFQWYNLIPRLSALEQVMLPLQYQGYSSSICETEATKALIRVGLGHKLASKPSELSGGQQQRIAIARAIAGSPSVLLADEPTGALDSKTGAEVLDIFQSLNDEWRTIILITHDPSVWAKAKRIVRILDGNIVE